LPEAAVWIYVVEPAEQMVLVEGGTMELSMGTQTVGTFYMGRNEVTRGEWQALVTWAVSAGYDWEVAFLMPAGCADDHPVYHVNWYDAVKWCNAKSEQDGLVPVYTVDSAVYRSGTFGWNESHLIMQSTSANGYRLPTEVEWEFAARGGVASQNYYYRGSDNLAEVAWFSSTSAGAACPLYGDQGTWPVGLKAANELGLYDVSGNVSEWCWDLYSGTAFRHIRGGGWGNGLAQCALSYRNAVDAAGRNNSIGFRLARNF
jgi:formylglycine-generating enzyme required for sulfatase activity